MDFLRKLFRAAPAPSSPSSASPPATPVQFDRPDMSAFGAYEPSIVTGFQYCATMQLRTPLAILRRHGTRVPFTPEGPPRYSDEMWHGIWSATTDLESCFEGVGATQATMASEVGYIPRDGGDYLCFLMAVREITEGAGSVEQKEADLREVVGATGPGGTRYATYIDADALIERALPSVLTLLPIGSNVVTALLDAGLSRLGDVSAATDAQLRAVRGLGPKSLAAIRAALPTLDVDPDARRFVSPEFQPLRPRPA